MMPGLSAAMALRSAAIVARVLAWLRRSGRHSTGATISESCGSTRSTSALAMKYRSGLRALSTWCSTTPSAMPVGWLATTRQGPEAGRRWSPVT